MRKTLEWVLAIVGATNGLLVVNTFVEFELSDGESILDLFFAPGIYFLEVVVISLLPIISLWKDDEKWLKRLWAGNGALLGLVVLGMWSIGVPLIPSLLFSVLLGISISLRQNFSLMQAAKITLTFLALQVIFMLLVIWLQLDLFINN